MKLTPAEYVARRPYQGYGAARQLWSCRDEEILMDGPAGTGKTRAILEKFHFCAMKYPGIRILLCRKTRESMTHTVLVTFEEKVVPPKFPCLQGPKRNLRQSYLYPNGSEIVVGGLDNTIKIMSSEYDLVGLFEGTETTLDDFELLTTRLRNNMMPYQQAVVDVNPGSPTHWLNQRAKSGLMTRFLSRHEDNPLLWDQKAKKWTEQGVKYLAKLERLSGARRLRLRYGKWVAAEGVVYDQYDELVHVIPKAKVNPAWPRLRAIDFGFNNPFVCQWWALTPDGDMIMYREIYKSKTLVSDHAKCISKYSEGETYLATVADHDAEDRATLENAGIYTTPAYKAIESGIEAVSLRLRPSGNGRPRLFLMRDALVERDEELFDKKQPVCTQHEFDAYMYPKNQEGKPVKEEPVDKDNHGMDAMRYAVCAVDNVSRMTFQVSTDNIAVVRAA